MYMKDTLLAFLLLSMHPYIPTQAFVHLHNLKEEKQSKMIAIMSDLEDS